jgi:hypothetical protein
VSEKIEARLLAVEHRVELWISADVNSGFEERIAALEAAITKQRKVNMILATLLDDPMDGVRDLRDALREALK